MSAPYTQQDVKNILEALAADFLVDIPAYFTDTGIYYIEYNTLTTELLTADDSWYDEIAAYANEELDG